MTKRRFRLRAAGLALFMAGFVVIFLILFGYAGGTLAPGHHYKVQAVVPNALALATHADVRQAGVKIGKVDKVALRGRVAVLMLELDDGHSPVYRNAHVLVRTKGQAGHADYVDLDPGTPVDGALPSGSVLSIEHSSESVQFDQILSTLDPRTRRRLQDLFDSLGEGLGNGKGLNAFLGGSASLTRESRPANEILAQDRMQLAGFVDDFGRVMRALGDRADAIRLLTRRSKAVAEAVAARDAALRDTLASLPGFLRQTDATTTRLGDFADRATPVMRNLRIGTERLAPAVRILPSASRRARQAMHALGGFTRAADPMLDRLRPFAETAARFTPPFEAFLRQFNPLQGYLAQYVTEMGALLANMKAASGPYDALGHKARLVAMTNQSSVPGGFAADQQKAYDALVKAGLLSPVDSRELSPYPKPGGAEKREPFTGTYPRIEADPPYSSSGRRRARGGRSG